MPCYRPLRAFKGDQGVSFVERKGYDQPIDLPCSRCIGCRIQRSSSWALRVMHEASLQPFNCFITLTYEETNLPTELNHRDFQLFMKRLRKHVSPEPVRYFMCGEYGEQNLRPHYHACLFNITFRDQKTYKLNDQGHYIYSSPTLDKLWGLGMSTVAPLNLQTAGYTARYFFKRNSLAEELGLKREYGKCSTNPGIGRGWFDKHAGTDMLPGDYVIHKGVRCPVPPYYDKLTKRAGLDLDQVKRDREANALKHRADNTASRLLVKEEVKTAQLRTLQRKL